MDVNLCLIILLSVFGNSATQTDQDVSGCPLSLPRNNYLKIYDGQCLQFVQTEQPWANAKSDCESRGGTLVMIKNAGKQKFIYNTLRSLHWRYNGLWIGASDRDKEGTWVWVDGSPVTYGYWHPGEGPSPHHGFFFSRSSFEDCAELRLNDGGRWHDYPCGGLGYHYSYICEYEQTALALRRCPSSVKRTQYLKAYSDQCLEFVLTERSWPDAKSDCSHRGGSLVSIKDAGKQTFVYNTLKGLHWKYHGVWIGASDRDKEGEWIWTDGSPVTYGNWHPGQGPTSSHGFFISPALIEDCAELRLDDGGKWHDYPCGQIISRYHYSYICEYGMVTTVQTTVKRSVTTRPRPTSTLPSTIRTSVHQVKTTIRPPIQTSSRQSTSRPRTSPPSTEQTALALRHCPSSLQRTQYLKAYSDQCLEFVLTERSWPDAKSDCSHRGGSLVSIKDAGKQTFVYNTLKGLHWKYHGVWIGASDRDKEGEWIWTDGSPVTYGNWHPGQGPTSSHGFFISPSLIEDCAELRLDDGGKWHDYPCGQIISQYHYSYICEYGMVTTAQTTVKRSVTTRPRPTTAFPTTIRTSVPQIKTTIRPPTQTPKPYVPTTGKTAVPFLSSIKTRHSSSQPRSSTSKPKVSIKPSGTLFGNFYHSAARKSHSNQQNKKSSDTGLIVGLVIGACALLALILVGGIFIRRKRVASLQNNETMSCENKVYDLMHGKDSTP